jgi:hypothetical protein
MAGCAIVLAASGSAAAGRPASRAVTAVAAPSAGTAGVAAAVLDYLRVGPGARVQRGRCPAAGCPAAAPVVVLGEPVIDGDRARVSVEQFRGVLAGEGRTLVLRRAGGRWRVVSAGRPDWLNWSGVRPRPGASVRAASSSATGRG